MLQFNAASYLAVFGQSRQSLLKPSLCFQAYVFFTKCCCTGLLNVLLLFCKVNMPLQLAATNVDAIP